MKGVESAKMDPALAMEVAALSQRRVLDEAIEKGNSDIQMFYENSTIFVTGGSGFLGKHMIEKLFRSCKLKKIFMLLRSKKGKTLEQRLSEIVNDPVYNDLKKGQPDFIKKLVAVNGDVTEPRLGLSDSDWLAITQEVEVIIHGAATISFDEPLKVATIINIKGTKEVLLLGKQCKKLKSFIHISTAYSHASMDRCGSEVNEKFYPAPVPPETMIQMAQNIDEATLEKITSSFIQKWPNTYSFTKAIAEELVREMAGDLPICIVRPAVVICCYREPSPGWIDQSCAYGPSGLIIGLGLGVVHVIYADLSKLIDLVPADCVNNVAIAAGWETARRHQAGYTGEPLIYTVTGTRNPMTIGQLEENLQRMRHLISPKAVWYCCSLTTKYKFMTFLYTWLFHYIPAYFIDALMRVIGKKPQFVKLYTKVYTLSTVFSYYLNNDWKFGDKNTQELQKNMSSTDREIYDFDISKIDRMEQVFIWYMGLRKYVIKDNLTGTNYAVRKQTVFQYLNYIVLALYAYGWWKILTYMCSGVTYAYKSAF